MLSTCNPQQGQRSIQMIKYQEIGGGGGVSTASIAVEQCF